MNETMMNFDVNALKLKLSSAGLTTIEAGKIIGRSEAFLYRPMREGRINRSDFYKLVHVANELIKKNYKEPVQLELPDIVLPAPKAKTEVESATEEITADIELIHKLGYEKICRLYELANYEKKYGFIKEDAQ